MKVLGIDASSKRSGVAAYDGITHTTLLFDHSKEENVDVRINLMMLELGKTIEKIKPDKVYIEDTFSKNNIDTTKKLSNIIGAVRYVCAKNKIEYKLILPSSWRKVLNLDSGKNTKRQEFKQRAMEYIQKNFNEELSEDVCEALCIAEAGYILENDSLFD